MAYGDNSPGTGHASGQGGNTAHGGNQGEGAGGGGGMYEFYIQNRKGYPSFESWMAAGGMSAPPYGGGGGGGVGSDRDRPGVIPYEGSLEDAWQPGAMEASQIYNDKKARKKARRAQKRFDKNYINPTLNALMEMQDPSMNPYLDEMYNIGAENIRNSMFDSLGSSGRGRPIYDESIGGNDVFANHVDSLSNFGTQFYGNAYNQDMNRALDAGQSMLTLGPGIQQERYNRPWNDLQSYTDIVSRLTGSSPAEQPDNGSNNLMSALGTGIAAFSAFASSEDFKDKTGETKGALDGVKALDTDRWRYNDNAPPGTDRVEHAGPYAEQFHEAFGLGDGKSIHPIDAHGVQFAALKELADEVDKLKRKTRAA